MIFCYILRENSNKGYNLIKGLNNNNDININLPKMWL